MSIAKYITCTDVPIYFDLHIHHITAIHSFIGKKKKERQKAHSLRRICVTVRCTRTSTQLWLCITHILAAAATVAVAAALYAGGGFRRATFCMCGDEQRRQLSNHRKSADHIHIHFTHTWDLRQPYAMRIHFAICSVIDCVEIKNITLDSRRTKFTWNERQKSGRFSENALIGHYHWKHAAHTFVLGPILRTIHIHCRMHFDTSNRIVFVCVYVSVCYRVNGKQIDRSTATMRSN